MRGVADAQPTAVHRQRRDDDDDRRTYQLSTVSTDGVCCVAVVIVVASLTVDGGRLRVGDATHFIPCARRCRPARPLTAVAVVVVLVVVGTAITHKCSSPIRSRALWSPPPPPPPLAQPDRDVYRIRKVYAAADVTPPPRRRRQRPDR